MGFALHQNETPVSVHAPGNELCAPAYSNNRQLSPDNAETLTSQPFGVEELGAPFATSAPSGIIDMSPAGGSEVDEESEVSSPDQPLMTQAQTCC